MENKLNGIVPEHLTGKKTELHHSLTLPSKEAAAKCYARARERLLNPVLWHQLGGVLSAEFYSLSPDGNPLARLAMVNDYVKIDIPGPGPTIGDGFDWVRVAQIENYEDLVTEEEGTGMKLVPCADPITNSHEIAHFFTADASSTFVIIRKGLEVTSYYYGRNETPNSHTQTKVDNIRNAIVASGALASLSEAQWLALIKGFLQPEIGG